MSNSENLYWFFYIVAFILAIFTGIAFGFQGDSHTPPIPYGVELIALPIGIIGFLYDFMKRKPVKVHYLGLGANGIVMLAIIIPALI